MGILNRRKQPKEPPKQEEHVLHRRKTKPRLPKKGSTSHWDLITKTGKEFCFVCNKPLKKKTKTNVVMIGHHKFTNEELWRHESCNAVSLNWANKFKEGLPQD